jgi:FAD/FMN-containing dehydrogenase
MGGHTIYPGGIVVNMRPFKRLAYDEGKRVVTAGAGALWSEIIAFLNARGRSVAIVQSFSSFTVGGSISVNAHGWQFREPPLGSSVVSMRVMLADGSVVRCSRSESAELFSLVLGGYGLFGIILDAELQTVPNERYRVERIVVPAVQYESVLQAKAAASDVAMQYGRLNVSSRAFLGEAILNLFHRMPVEPNEGAAVPPLAEPSLAGLRRAVFRASVGSDYGKRMRWNAEKRLEEHMATAPLWRNQLLDDDVALYEDRSAEDTEVLQELFLPEGRMEAFLVRARRIIPAHGADLLNVTIRNVQEDRDSFLRWADRPTIALVFLFHQKDTAEADRDMEPLTRALIDAALTQGGRYYLPYRLHATREQLAAAYPLAGRFFERKRHYDPGELFQNRFYATYGKPGEDR